jgi:glycerol-3-phosphate dehydrogenase
MRRDLASLSRQLFDLLVVGGGIHGLTIACDAAQRGLSVALIERDDFGSGASFNHLRTIHGGLRYLQTLDLRRSRESIRERRTLARIAPHCVQPLMFVLPVRRSITKGRLAMRAGLLLDRIVAFDRNDGVSASHRLPPGRVISTAEAAERFPGLRRRQLTGAALWYDYVTTEADRLTWSWALAASDHGAELANYVEAASIVSEAPGGVVVHAIDRRSGEPLDIRARVVVNATGGGVDHLITASGLPARVPVLRAMNLVTRRDAGAEALGGVTASGRTVFLVPWRGKALFGTWESARTVAPEDHRIAQADVLSFIDELNHAFPALDLTADDVTLVHRGNVPAATRSGTVTLAGHEQIQDHAADGMAGVISVAGAKYTTARAVAERVTSLVMDKLGLPAAPCRTAGTPLPGGDLGDPAAAVSAARRDYDRVLASDALPHLVAAYGSRFSEVVRLGDHDGALLAPLSGRSPVIGAEILWAARHEMALTLADAVVRRTPLGALGHPGDEAVRRAAVIMARECGWAAAEIEQQVAAVNAFYNW